LPLVSVVVALLAAPVSVTETPVVPDTAPEIVYPELVLVPLLMPLLLPAPVELLGCAAALVADDAEVPL
jgi:hypothetical protein